MRTGQVFTPFDEIQQVTIELNGCICDAAQVWGGPRATEHTKECLLPRRPGC